ncbi:MAG: hypothetical protein ACI9U2_003237 [Bradymonadia bacterium]|jgi:hypothetical protein
MRILLTLAALLAPSLVCAQGAPPAPTAPPALQRIATTGGEVSVDMPKGADWQCAPRQGSQGPNSKVWMVKCKLKTGGFFFMVAKVYTVPAADAKTAEQLVKEVYPIHYAKLFAKQAISAVNPVKIAGQTGLSYRLTAEHAKKGPILKDEQVVVVGDRTYILSAEGDPAAFAAHAQTFAAWAASATFATPTRTPAVAPAK